MTSERRLAAIMFTDLVGFSALTQKNEALALELVDTKKQLLNPLLDQHKGSLIKTMGDGFLVEFSSALQAVQCAMGIQSMLQGYNNSQAAERKINLRIGIHLGDVEFKDGDVFGDGVNIASRIEPLAEPGGVCVSGAIHDQVEGKLEARFESLGTPALKNIARQIEIFSVAPRGASEKTAAPPAANNQDEVTEKSIAVLPFVNMSADPENEYFSDGITEELIDALAKLGSLKVISRTSVFHFKGKDFDLPTIGEKLGVNHILEGSVRKSGEKIRLTAQLINVPEDAHIWSDRFDREIDDVFAVQEEIARSIVDVLKVKLIAKDETQLVKQSTDSTEAYNLYLQGRYFWNQRNSISVPKAISFYERSLEADPNFALAYAGLADCYILFPQVELQSPKESFPKAIAAAEKALELDDQLAEAHSSMAGIKAIYEWDYAGAKESAFKAIELNPGLANAHQRLAIIYGSFGEIDNAIESIRKAIELDPLAGAYRAGLSYMYFTSGMVDEGLAQLKLAREFSPSLMLAQMAAMGLSQVGRYDLLIEYCEPYLEDENASTLIVASMANAYAKVSRTAEANALLERVLKRSETQYVSGYAVAMMYAGFGDNEKTLQWLELAVEDRDFWLSVLLPQDKRFQDIATNERFKQIIEKLGLPD